MILDAARRYKDLGQIAIGGMGEIRRVRDRHMDRILVMKILRGELASNVYNHADFQHEARVTSRLQHPGVVPVHDHGRLEDGRPWFTMKEIKGHTFRKLISDVHSHAQGELAQAGALRASVKVLLRVAEAVAYAHQHGVIHRDIKPDNIMVGDFGEVLLMDWGLAWLVEQPNWRGLAAKQLAQAIKHGNAPAENVFCDPTRTGIDVGIATLAHRPTVVPSEGCSGENSVAGTLQYMAPECAAGAIPHEQADVYSLGAVLYELMAGRPPYQGTLAEIWLALFQGPPCALADIASVTCAPLELRSICEAAMNQNRELRCRDAHVVALRLRDWLDGTERRIRAQRAVEAADAMLPEIKALHKDAQQLQARADEILRGVQPFDAVKLKAPGWELQSEASKLIERAEIHEVRRMQRLRSALEVLPDYGPAHSRLADFYQRHLEEAERRRDLRQAAYHEELLRQHAQPKHIAFLSGNGIFSLVTDPPGAKVNLYRFEERDRELVPVDRGICGRTPLQEVHLARGSYLVILKKEGFDDVFYPMLIERSKHWDGVAPRRASAHKIKLLSKDELDEDDCYVPAGWFMAGGDESAIDALPGGWRWLYEYVIKRDPVTTREYLTFLNALIDDGKESQALAHAPSTNPSVSEGMSDRVAFSRDKDGRFVITGNESPPEHLDWPVVRINWHDATAYAQWYARVTGQPWRLPDELEWEKAARGVDGRRLPWGDWPEPTKTYVLESREHVLWRVPVDEMEQDISVYGVRGTAGNVVDWCSTLWSLYGRRAEGGGTLKDVREHQMERRVVRGTSWLNPIAQCRCATRFADRPEQRRGVLGFRLARSVV